MSELAVAVESADSITEMREPLSALRWVKRWNGDKYLQQRVRVTKMRGAILWDVTHVWQTLPEVDEDESP